MKRFIAIGSILVILAVTVWYFCLYASPLVISPETTYITAPLMSDGKRIDYFRAWEERAYPPEMKTDENGYRILVRAIGDPNNYFEYNHETGFWDKRTLDPKPLRLQVYEKLGLDSTIPPTLKIESADTFMMRYIKEHPEADNEQWSQRHYRPWTFADRPMLEEWIAENDAGINLLSEAVGMSVFRAPEVRKSEDETLTTMFSMLGNAQTFREFARALSARAYYRIGIGDIDGAIEDKIACYHLARHAGKQGGTTLYLVGLALEGMAASIHIGANPNAPPSREQLRRLFDAIRALLPPQKLEDCWDFDRLLTLSYVQEYAFGGKLNFPGALERGLWSFAVDWNRAFRNINESFDALVAGVINVETNQKPWENLWPLLTVRQRTRAVSERFNSHGVVPHIREAERRRQCAENMKLLTLALLLYEKDRGKLPDGDWRVAVRPYLGDDADKYFRCPSHSGLADDETTYAMIRRESGVTPSTPYTLLLVEVFPPMKMTGNDGTIPAALARFDQTEGLGSNHPGGCNVSYRSGAVAFMTRSMNITVLQSLIDGTSDTPW